MLLEFTLTFFVFILTLIFLLNPLKSPKNAPPGPATLPLIGNVLQIASAHPTNPYYAFEALAKKWGDVMTLWFGVHQMVVLSSYEAMKEVMTKTESNWERLVFPFVPDRAFGNVERGIIWNFGESWQELKRWSLRTLRDFGFGKRNSMDLVMREEINEFVSMVKEKLKARSGIWRVNVELLAAVSMNVLWSFVAGSRFGLKDEKLRKAVTLNDKIIHAVGLTNRYAAFPWVKKWFPKWSQHKEHLKCYDDLIQFFKEILKDIKAESAGREPENFIEAFLYEIDQRGGSDRDFNEEQLIVILQDLFLAGSETTSTTMAWIILYLALYPQVQQKVFEEIKEVAGATGAPSLDLENKLVYTKAMIYEVIRMSPTVPSPGPRAASADIQLESGYVIPKGAGIAFNLIPIFNDPNYWDCPEQFNPDRFISKDGTKIVNTERMAIFGLGRRLCLGESIAWNSLILFTSTLVKELEISVVSGQPTPTLEPKVAGTLSPQPFSVFLRSRN